PALNRYMGIYPAIVLTSALFTLAHFPQIRDDFHFIAIIFSLSLVITYARAKTGSTLVAMVMHHVYNLSCVAIGLIKYFIYKY
ncbi:MAG: CPBP family intramembrane glutamic endopeptidase, partial [Candidatus Omnitrophota bacterium]